MITGTSGRSRAHLRQHFQPAHAGHVDVGQDQDQRRIANFSGARQRRRRRRRKFHREASGLDIAPELLAEQGFDVGLVIDDEDVNAQFVPPASACAAAVRGSVMMNSVNAPGSVSTSIVPPCCFTTMSWLIDRPSPVPSPGRLGGEEGIEHLLLHFQRDAGAVVADPDFHLVAEAFRGRAQRRLESPRRPLPCAWSRHRSRWRSG